jgi:hypothetical protein
MRNSKGQFIKMSSSNKTFCHFLLIPFTGLGLYNGFRGNYWLRSRIKIFKQFVVPSLLNQTCKDFILWVSWRYEEKENPQVRELKQYLDDKGLKSVFTFSGCPFWDDKYEDSIAHERLINAIHGAMGDLLNVMGEAKTILYTIQPSDDIYYYKMVEEVQKIFDEQEDVQAVSYKKGYVMDYIKGRLAEWNPATNPPFFTIKFPRETFIDPIKHVNYTGPYKSHEYIGDKLNLFPIYDRGFLVGTHTANISTVFDHPYANGDYRGEVKDIILSEFGIDKAGPLVIQFSIRSKIFHYLPYKVKRKLRYWSECNWLLRPLFASLYNFMRS